MMTCANQFLSHSGKEQPESLWPVEWGQFHKMNHSWILSLYICSRVSLPSKYEYGISHEWFILIFPHFLAPSPCIRLHSPFVQLSVVLANSFFHLFPVLFTLLKFTWCEVLHLFFPFEFASFSFLFFAVKTWPSLSSMFVFHIIWQSFSHLYLCSRLVRGQKFKISNEKMFTNNAPCVCGLNWVTYAWISKMQFATESQELLHLTWLDSTWCLMPDARCRGEKFAQRNFVSGRRKLLTTCVFLPTPHSELRRNRKYQEREGEGTLSVSATHTKSFLSDLRHLAVVIRMNITMSKMMKVATRMKNRPHSNSPREGESGS